MESEYQILTHLNEDELTTQRKISKRTGLSLGAVNILIKKMVRKGLVKVEKLNARTMRYILTPQGMKEKTRLTYQFVRHSYQRILTITSAVETLIQQYQAEQPFDQLVLYGPADEVEQILKNALGGMNIDFKTVRPVDDGLETDIEQLVLTWRYEDEEKLPEEIRAVNILSRI